MTPPPPPEELLAHEGFVRAIARKLLYDKDEVEDVVQETWLAALERPPRERESLRTWLAHVAHNLAIDVHRRRARVKETESRGARAESLPSTGEALAEWDARRALVEAISELREPYRSALVLQFFEKLPPREVARLQNVPVETVRTRVKRGLGHLREKLVAKRGDARACGLALVPLAGPRPIHLGPFELPWRASRGAIAFATAAFVALVLGVGIGALDRPRAGSTSSGDVLAADTSGIAKHADALDAASSAVERASAGDALDLVVVREDDGAPVAGAELAIAWGAPGSGGELRATSDASGRARVQPPSGVAWTLAVSGTDGTLARDAAPLVPGAHEEPVTRAEPVRVTVARASTVAGRVVDAADRPVANARLRAWFGGPPRDDAPPDRVLASAADGSYRLGGMPGCFWLSADDGTRISISSFYARVAHARDFEHVDLAVVDPRAFRGVVVDARTGAPVAGAVITCTSGAASAFPVDRGPVDGAVYHFSTDKSASSDASGRFVLEGCTPLRPVLRVARAGYRPLVVRRVVEPLELAIEPERSLVVDVADADGTPIAGARVHFNSSVRGPATPVTDSRGRARFGAIEIAFGTLLKVEAAGFATRLVEDLDDRALDDVVRVRMERESACTLAFTTNDGTPLAGARVEARFACSRARDVGGNRSLMALLRDLHQLGAGDTDERGAFTLHGAGSAVVELTVQSSKGAFAPATFAFDPRAERRSWRLDELAAAPGARSLSGAVRGDRGEPLAGARVTAIELTEPARRLFAGVGADGTYSIELPGEGAWLVDARADGRAAATHAIEGSARARDASRYVHHDFALLPARDLVLSVVDAAGRPVGGALLFLRDEAGDSVFARSGTVTASDHVLLGKAGDAFLEALPETRVRLTLLRRGIFAPAEHVVDLSRAGETRHVWRLDDEIAASEREVELDLGALAGDASARWELRALDAAGAAVAGWEIACSFGEPRLAPRERCAVLTVQADDRPIVCWSPPLNDDWLYGAHGEGAGASGYRLPVAPEIASLELATPGGAPIRWTLPIASSARAVWRPSAR